MFCPLREVAGVSAMMATHPCVGVLKPGTAVDISLYMFRKEGGMRTPLRTEKASPCCQWVGVNPSVQVNLHLLVRRPLRQWVRRVSLHGMDLALASVGTWHSSPTMITRTSFNGHSRDQE